MTVAGGPHEVGTRFMLNLDGSGFTVLHDFKTTEVEPLRKVLMDAHGYGASPITGLRNDDMIFSGRTFYGTTHIGGSAQGGTVFKINADGTSFKVLHDFFEKPIPPDLTD